MIQNKQLISESLSINAGKYKSRQNINIYRAVEQLAKTLRQYASEQAINK